MSWKVLAVTFGLIFLAELGDKTQLATMMLSAQSKAPVAVFLGAALALVLTSLLGVVVGGVIGKFVPARYIQIGAGVLFVVLGALLIAGKS